MEQGFRSGFVGLIGRTNVGKSTFINSVLKQKVVIITDKPQTTRAKTNCIYNDKDSQIIFMDCPGFFKPHDMLGKRLNQAAMEVIKDADILAAMVDVYGGIGGGDLFMLEKIKVRPQPKILLLNKVDLVDEERLEEEKNKISVDFFQEIIPVSARTGYNIPLAVKAIKQLLSPGPRYYDNDVITDQPLEKAVADIIREKLSSILLQELPHSISVIAEIGDEKLTKSGEKIRKVSAEIYTEKESQKAIVIGKSGRILKEAGQLARKEIEPLLGCKAFVELWVKVEENWTRNDSMLKKFGYY